MIKLKNLIGLKRLSGVDFKSSIKRKSDWEDDEFEDANCCRFVLEGTVYCAVENPSDGYRSSMRELLVNPEGKVENRFPPILVLCRHISKSEYKSADLLELIDVKTAEVVLLVGTDNTEDYYPVFVASFRPENMISNQKGIGE